MNSQKIRRSLVLGSALLFPVTMIYFSPGMVFRGARLGVLSGSYITFFVLFVASVFFGRAWCGWLCPAAGFSEIAQQLNNSPFKANRMKNLKYWIWIVWLIAIASVVFFVGGGFKSIDPFLGTNRGISIHNISLLAAYYMVVGIIVVSSLTLGRRGFCHSLCWMAPFMVLGRKLCNASRLPALRLSAKTERCAGCQVCESVCPMSLPVKHMVNTRSIENVDCVLCGACVKACPKQVLCLAIERIPLQHD